jgi:exonuclease SbcC
VIIEKLTLQGWRVYREPCTFEFAEKVTLLVGPNGVGKSTILEALHRAFFDRHGGVSDEIKAIQPMGTSLAPSVTVVFKTNGKKYRIMKQFLRDAHSELREEVHGTFQLVADGDAADELVCQMVGGEFPAKGASKPLHRGLAEALWYFQRETPLPEKAWNEGVRKGLSGVIQIAIQSPLEDKIGLAIDDDFRQIFTPTGQEKRGQGQGELASTRERVAVLERELETLRSQRDSIRDSQRSLERLEVEMEEKTKEKDERQAERTRIRKLLETSGELGQDKARAEAAFAQAKDQLKALMEVQENLDRKGKQAESLGEELLGLIAESETKGRELTTEWEAVRRARQERNESIIPELKRVEEELEQLQALERWHNLSEIIGRLERHIQRLETTRQELKNREKEIEELKAPTKQVWERFQALSTDLRIKEGEARASAIRVGIETQKKGIRVRVEPDAPVEGKDYVVARPTTFHIEGTATVRVRALGESLERLNHECESMRKEVARIIARFGAENEETLAGVYAKGESLHETVRALRKKLKDLGREEPDADRELLRSRREAEEEEAKLSSLSPETREWGGEKIRAMSSELKSKKRRLVHDSDLLEKKENTALERVEKLRHETSGLDARISGKRATKNQLEKDIESILRGHGSRTLFNDELVNSQREVAKKEKEVSRLQHEYQEKVEGPQRQAEIVEKAVTELSNRIKEIEVETARHQEKVTSIVGQGVYTSEGDKEAELEWLRNRLAVLVRRADAIKLLHAVFQQCQENRIQALTLPIREIVDPWFRTLTDDDQNRVDIGTNLLPSYVTADGKASIPVQWLSYGTHEQLVVLVRLAMGVLASKKERSLVVLDDRLVNADPVRARRLAGILVDAGEKCQVVMTTCNDMAYAGIEARVIQVPGVASGVLEN